MTLQAQSKSKPIWPIICAEAKHRQLKLNDEGTSSGSPSNLNSPMTSGRERLLRTERVWMSKRRRRVKMEWTTLYSIEILRIITWKSVRPFLHGLFDKDTSQVSLKRSAFRKMGMLDVYLLCSLAVPTTLLTLLPSQWVVIWLLVESFLMVE
eukprot:scaffold31634_cov80-Skeletonema_dohrnii-CCMP3373.AAC.3